MGDIARKQNILFQWLSWQFFDVPKEILTAWRNFLLFALNYFSTPFLLKTLFFYWRRYGYSYGRGFDIKRYFEALTFNIISRAIGAFVRSIFIVVGIFFEAVVVILGAMVFVGWFLLPIILITGLWFGIKLIFG